MTRQFDVFHNPAQQNRGTAPYLVVLQSHHLSAIDTVVVAPPIRPEAMKPDGLLSLEVDVDGVEFTAAIALVVNMQAKRLTSRAGSLDRYEDDIRRALDRLFTGF